MALYIVAQARDIEEGAPLIVSVQGRSIGIYRIGDSYYALHNRCPHEGAELCKGPVCGTVISSQVYQYEYGRTGEIVRCPWHGWEFDIKTGKSLFNERVRTRSYKVSVVEGNIAVEL